MITKSSSFLNQTIGILIVFILSIDVFAQPLWLDRRHNKTIAYEFLKPDFKNLEGTTFLTSAMFLSGRFATSNAVIIVAEIPFVNYGRDSETGESYNESAFGNPYLGLEFHSAKSRIFGEVGFRLPVVLQDDNRTALIVGTYTDFVDRVEAFIPEIVPFNVLINYNSISELNFGLRVRGGFTGWIPSGGRDGSEWFLIYGIQGGYQTEQVNILFGISGRIWVSSSDTELSESISNQFVVTTDVSFGQFQPGIILKIPLDDNLKDIVKLVFGVSLAVNLE